KGVASVSWRDLAHAGNVDPSDVSGDYDYDKHYDFDLGDGGPTYSGEMLEDRARGLLGRLPDPRNAEQPAGRRPVRPDVQPRGGRRRRRTIPDLGIASRTHRGGGEPDHLHHLGGWDEPRRRGPRSRRHLVPERPAGHLLASVRRQSCGAAWGGHRRSRAGLLLRG